MNILYFSHLFPTEHEPGCGIFNLQRIKALKKAGHDIVVAVPVTVLPPVKFVVPVPRFKKIIKFIKNTCSISNETEGPFPVYYLNWIPIPRKIAWGYQHIALHLCIRKKISKIIQEHKPDVVITSVLHPEGSYAKYFKLKYNLPVITIAEGSEVLIYPSLYKGIHSILKTINIYSDKVIFVSKEMANRLTARYHFSNYSIINNGYNNETFHYSPISPRNNPVKRIISVGKLDYVKGHDLLLEAAINMPDTELTIIGEGDLYNDYSRYIKNNSMEDRVVIKNHTKPAKLKVLLQEHDIFCMPSRSESFGIASLEALACGLPVVAANTGIMPEVIKNGVNGFILEELTSACLEKYLLKAIDYSWNNKEISESVMDYSWEKWAGEMLETAREIIK